MIIAVEGTKAFNDYPTFMRAMSVAMSQTNSNNEFEIWSAGPYKVTNFAAAFTNSSENYLRNRGYRIFLKRLPLQFVKDNISDVNYLASFAKRGEPASHLSHLASEVGVEVGIFRV